MKTQLIEMFVEWWQSPLTENVRREWGAKHEKRGRLQSPYPNDGVFVIESERTLNAEKKMFTMIRPDGQQFEVSAENLFTEIEKTGFPWLNATRETDPYCRALRFVTPRSELPPPPQPLQTGTDYAHAALLACFRPDLAAQCYA